MVDNIEEIIKHMTFENERDRYALHIFKRPKDQDGRSLGSNETQRYLRTYYINSKEYLENKIPAIKKLCEDNTARAYFLPQVRDNRDVLKHLGILAIENLDNPTCKVDHLARKAFCGFHSSRAEKWILDLDDDNMTEYTHVINFGGSFVKTKVWTPEEVLALVKKFLVECGRKEDDAYMIPTRHGHCIVTSPFNLKKAQEECSMIFIGQGEKVVSIDKQPVKSTYLSDHLGSHLNIEHTKKINGWLIKDGLALMYCPF